MADVQYRRFPAGCTDEGPDVQTRAWMTARYNGFLQAEPSADQRAAVAGAWQDEGRILHAIHDRGPRPDTALSPDVPVATLATIGASLNAGEDEDIPCTLIADVTVRATHQGQGLMRRLMEAVTTEAVDAGVPLLALHAAHPALYARFGFSPAIRSSTVEVDCARFALLRDPPGTVHAADPRHADEQARAVAASSGPYRFGALAVTHPARNQQPDDEHPARCLVHADERGNVDGVLTYVFRGWTPQAQVLDVLSETYSTFDAHAALWQAISSTGIASTVCATDMRPDDPLPWMLTDRAAWRVTGLNDGYSLRIVDPARALLMRGYSAADAQLAVDVTDRTGPASGRWLIRLSGGRASIEPTSRAADVTLDVAELAASFLGTTNPTTLLSAGRVTASRAAANGLDTLLGWPVQASSTLHF
ncbi:GNAT family N-acetyltransferase [Angustibacter sp. McL0619]|uniref:GNAT family N-acetyltransferase n=1 Tax=Angustibacter sp. McL0619 TaxID=3415676 RepID=UPI003CF3B18B